MGCGGSKGAEVKNSTMATTVEAPPSTTKVEVSQSGGDKNAAATTQPQQNDGSSQQAASATPGDKENKKEDAAKEGMNPSADLSVTGRKIESRGGARNSSSNNNSNNPASPGGSDDDYDSRMTSAVSTRSAPPSIMERPSSRGGRAFEISFDDDVRRPPRRLQKLQHSSKRRKGDLTLDQLQKKLEAAEKRKKDYEQRILDKISVDTRRPADRREQQTEEQAKQVEQKVDQKVDKAMKNREAHLRSLREKLRARDEHRNKVQEKKQQLKAEGETEA